MLLSTVSTSGVHEMQHSKVVQQYFSSKKLVRDPKKVDNFCLRSTLNEFGLFFHFA